MTDRLHDSGSSARDDETTEQLARDLHEQVRRLNHATTGAPGLTRPATVYTVLGSLGGAAHGLGQTLDQLGEFLIREHRAGRFGHDQGEDLQPLIRQAGRLLQDARLLTAQLKEHLGDCQTMINAVHGPLSTTHDTTPQAHEPTSGPPNVPPDLLPTPRSEEPTIEGNRRQGRSTSGEPRDVPRALAGQSFPLPLGEALKAERNTTTDLQGGPGHRPAPRTGRTNGRTV